MVAIKDKWLQKIIPEPNTGCHFWLGCTSHDGYGKVSWKEEGEKCYGYIHRLLYEAYKGPIPEGLELDHKCNNRLCCNIDHLQAITHLANMRRWITPDSENFNNCPSGHAFTKENTRIEPDGGRRCKKCLAIRALARYHRTKFYGKL